MLHFDDQQDFDSFLSFYGITSSETKLLDIPKGFSQSGLQKILEQPYEEDAFDYKRPSVSYLLRVPPKDVLLDEIRKNAISEDHPYQKVVQGCYYVVDRNIAQRIMEGNKVTTPRLVPSHINECKEVPVEPEDMEVQNINSNHAASVSSSDSSEETPIPTLPVKKNQSLNLNLMLPSLFQLLQLKFNQLPLRKVTIFLRRHKKREKRGRQGQP
eukprot:TRINITY_DN8593_c0_g1_i1.p1 TRINITY_DN8593_c0_g1~~TRINITY_DN8593_c0_g1_i1.p1  ORF type:complete len:234 (+),score=32.41 TRINITY_DN8593_c0_g1_i1:65-703(+)